MNDRRAVGGHVADNPTTHDGAADGADELRAFDGKVYRAQCQMVREMGGKLRGLGVPFFGTRGELIIYENSDAAMNAVEEGREGGRKMITEKELLEMQRRMLGILEDLCAS